MTDPVDPADVSVIMPAHNAADCIGRALASIAGQTVRPREVIIVDDGSTDATLDAVRAMIPHMQGVCVRLFSQANSGAGMARNRAISVATGTWLAFLDSDDAWVETKLEHSLAVTVGGNLVMSAHNLWGIDQNGQHYIDSRARYLIDPARPFRSLFLRGFISSSTVLVRRDAVLRAGGFDAGLRSGQDYELWLTILAEAGERFTIFENPLLLYTLSPTGITSLIDRKFGCSIAIMKRHMGTLKRMGQSAVRLVMMRSLILHVETIRGLLAQGQKSKAMGYALAFPLRTLGLLAHLPKADGARPDFMACLTPATEIDLP